MPNRSVLMTAVVALVLGFGFYNFALKPKHKESSKLDAQISQAQSDLTTAQGLLAANQQAKGSFKRAYANVVRLGKAVPGDDDVRSLVVQLDASARRAGIDFKSINVGGTSGVPVAGATGATPLPPGATIGPAGFPVMPFSFEFTGQFFALGRFFRDLDRYVSTSNDKLAVTGRLLTIDGIKLAPAASGFPSIQATVAATSYLVSPLEGATGGATAAGPAAAPVSGTADPAAGTTSTAVTQ